ncbi:T9SS type A sorting domain-containing protein [Empedobacter brevis]|uniref:T9SS type A sorting domain-containing protein n=1 Tax=Empedobacter brevis TaxID=247 RepID=UPI0028A0B515|nr:T9SS type A sorting domain-containing protein [Empedobacter brevis]
MNFKHLFFSTLLVSMANNLSAQQFIKSTSGEYFNLTGVSQEGKMVGYPEATLPYYIWDPTTKSMEEIGGSGAGQGFGGQAKFSNDGNYLSGTSINVETGLGEISRYNIVEKKWKTLGSLGFDNGFSTGSGFNISGDGKTIVGGGWVQSLRMKGIAWNEKEGLINLETLIEKRNTRATAVSYDGSVVAGYQESTRGEWYAAIWKKNPNGGYYPNHYIYKNPKGDLNDPTNIMPEITAISGDGKWVGGVTSIASPNTWIWSEETGVIDLGALTAKPNTTGLISSISHDGKIVLGYYISRVSLQQIDYTPFIWTPENGIIDFNQYVKDVLKIDLGNDVIRATFAISSNNQYIVGWGKNGNSVFNYRIELPKLGADDINQDKKATLYPNPVTNVLNIDSKDKIEEVTIYTLTGQQILNKLFKNNRISIDVSSYKTGVYMVEVKTISSTRTYKVIKK